MREPPLIVLGYSEAAMFVNEKRSQVGAVLSIVGQREFAIESTLDRHLILNFDDVATVDEADPISVGHDHIRQRREAKDGLRTSPPALAHAEAIVEFARSIAGIDGSVLCHCHAGISRSPAAAIVMLATWRGASEEASCVEEVRALRVGAVPHRGVIDLGDRVLGRDGSLLRAFDNVYQ